MSVAKLFAALLGLSALALAAPAQATWYKAETDRFIVYGAGFEGAVRDYAVKLQTFDAVLRLYHPSTAKRTPDTKVQLYLVRSRDGLRQVKPGMPREVAGWYNATNEGVFAMAVTDGGLGEDDVLFHEYAHHFMLENFPAAYPAWFVEGFAEYFMTTDINTVRGTTIGGYNPGRAYGVFNETWLPMDQLLSKSVWEVPKARRQAFYAQSWLLMHYLRSDPARAAQLNKATQAISAGAEPVKAVQDATGMDMTQLTAALRKYNKLPTVRIKDFADKPQVTVTRLPPSADDLLLDNLRLLTSSTGAKDDAFLASVRRKAERYPGDRLAETTLARAEFVMGDVPAGEAIMTRLLAASPDDEELVLEAGTGQLLAGIRDRAKRDAYYRAARPLFMKAYKLDKRDFRPLYAYALSRTIEPAYPNDNDLNALLEARALAPAVQELSLRAGVALLARDRKAEAVRVFAPVINNPHGGSVAAQAKALLEGKTERQAEAEGRAAEETPVEPQTPPEPAKPPAPKPS